MAQALYSGSFGSSLEKELMKGFRLSHSWKGMLMLTAIIFVAGLACLPSESVYYGRKAAKYIARQDFDAALRVGMRSRQTDSTLTALRAYALYRQGRLGECLFEYPLVGSSAVLNRLPANDKQRKLCALLLDRKIDAFANALLHNDSLNASLPKHYREALTLYTHIRSNPVLVYKDNVTSADFEDFQKLEKENPDPRIRANRVYDNYGNTYWYYYFYACRSK